MTRLNLTHFLTYFCICIIADDDNDGIVVCCATLHTAFVNCYQRQIQGGHGAMPPIIRDFFLKYAFQ